MIVQRALAAKSVGHAKGACIFAAFLKVLPMFLIVIPGMISRVLFTDSVACVDPDDCMRECQSETGCTNVAYPKLVVNVMPTGNELMVALLHGVGCQLPLPPPPHFLPFPTPGSGCYVSSSYNNNKRKTSLFCTMKTHISVTILALTHLDIIV